jgi:hypothetical protein
VVARGHHSLATERSHHLKNPLIVGGYQDFIQPRALLAALPNMLNQWLSRDVMQRLTRKSRGPPPRGENTKNMDHGE